MAKLPTDTRLKVEQQIEDEWVIQEPRPYLGISGIGEKCARSLWYGFRLCSQQKISQRMHRLFQRGHREEPIIQADLRKIGIHHHSAQKEVTACSKHIKGHIDDLLDFVPDAPKTTHLGEYKTHNDKSFKDLKNKGIRLSKPIHYAQMICYMYLLKITRALYIAVNKDNDARYYERISANKEKAEELIQRATDIISTEIPPEKIGGSTWFECKWCGHYEICHFSELPLKNCRTCEFCDLHDEGKWKCSGFKIWLSFPQQLLGCKKHRYMKGLK